jgi:hypothetical protein
MCWIGFKESVARLDVCLFLTLDYVSGLLRSHFESRIRQTQSRPQMEGQGLGKVGCWNRCAGNESAKDRELDRNRRIELNRLLTVI